MVIRDFKYTAEDVDCQYCLHYRYGRCCSKKCVCFKERIEAGVVSYPEAIKETFDKNSPLRPRIEIVLNFYNKLFWKDEAHFKRFQLMDAILGYYKRRNTSEYYAALFLLTSDEELVARTLDCFGKRKINFANVNLRDISPERYALYKIAKCLYSDSAEVGVDELADPDLVNTESFHLVINAMLIYRYGLSVMYLKGGDACARI